MWGQQSVLIDWMESLCPPDGYHDNKGCMSFLLVLDPSDLVSMRTGPSTTVEVQLSGSKL